MSGRGRDWAIGLGGIALISLAASTLVGLAPGKRLFSDLAMRAEDWAGTIGEARAAAPEPSDDGFHVPDAPDDALPPAQPANTAAPSGTGQTSTKPAQWRTNDDYPAEALRNKWQGAVRIEWTIDETGSVTDCKVLESSGYPVLDEASCNLIMRRARYLPANDAEGRPVALKDTRRIVWRLPK